MPIRRPRRAKAKAEADPLDAAQADRVRAVLALGGVAVGLDAPPAAQRQVPVLRERLHVEEAV
ncbi:hypothetical protein ACH4ZX_34145 [Streptomyces sp. NPDC020490]|uniref:hypothetical protein n=1 Tax=Streptomyces sp. NPDC020490 TaxID=3365078 RepID=UPI00378F1560